MHRLGSFSGIARFGVFELDVRAHELRKRGRRVPLQQQPFKLLQLLIERCGEVVARDELRRELWQDGTFVDFDDGLNTAIRKVREALGDSADVPRFVETLPRCGYRFLAPVEYDALPPVADDTPTADRLPRQPVRRPVRQMMPWIAVPILALLGTALAMVPGSSDDEGVPAVTALRRLTAAPGVERQPGWSPDGSRVAYTADVHADMDVWVRQAAAADTALLLTPERPGFDGSPTWSPDGAFIAFASEFNGGGIDIVSSLGGEVRRVATVPFRTTTDLVGSIPTIAWSADGLQLAYAYGIEGRTGLYVVPASGGTPRRVPVEREVRAFSIAHPSWSPDGRRIAFAALSGAARTVSQVWTVGADGSGLRPVTDGDSYDVRPVWSRDGGGIFFLSNRAGTSDLYWVPVDASGTARRAPTALTVGLEMDSFGIAANERRLAYAKSTERSNIWTMPVTARSPGGWPEARPLTTENHTLEFLETSRDGRWIVFDSARAGNSDIWRMRPDGSELQQIVSTPAEEFHPSLSPDGRSVAFHALAAGNREIHVAPIGGGASTRLTDNPAKDWLPSWSPDGKWIAFCSDRSGNQDIFLVSPGGQSLRRITSDGANDHNPIWSPDGRRVLFASNRDGHDALYLIDRDGGAPVRFASQSWDDVVPLVWLAATDTVYAWGRGQGSVGFWRLGPDRRAELFLRDAVSRQLGIALAVAGDTLLFPVWERGADIWIADLARR